jgi:hypothetical protein
VTDTEILDQTIALLGTWSMHGLVISPARARIWIDEIHKKRNPLRRVDDSYTNGTSFSDQTVSEFYKTPGPYAVQDGKKGDPYYPSLHEQRPHFDRDITGQYHQNFWRCPHHPSAIVNWFDGKTGQCAHGCDPSELRWCDNGTCKPPTSSN